MASMDDFEKSAFRSSIEKWLCEMNYWIGFIDGQISQGKLTVPTSLGYLEALWDWYHGGLYVQIRCCKDVADQFREHFERVDGAIPTSPFAFRVISRSSHSIADAQFLQHIKFTEQFFHEALPSVRFVNKFTSCEMGSRCRSSGSGGLALCILHDRKWICPLCQKFLDDRRSRKFDGFAYLLSNEERTLFKLGRSTDPMSRVKALSGSYPFPLKLLHEIEADEMKRAEEELHLRFDSKRTNGEWFTLSSEEVTLIRQIERFQNGRFFDASGNHIRLDDSRLFPDS